MGRVGAMRIQVIQQQSRVGRKKKFKQSTLCERPLDLLLHLVDVVSTQPLHPLQKINLHTDDGADKDIGTSADSIHPVSLGGVFAEG